jgi:uncharacterized protein YndB with AHSA1/START domain
MTLSSFATDIKINAPVEQVWQALADIGNIYLWNPGVVASHRTTEQTEGVGACRYCDLGGNNYLDEKVVEWEDNKRLTMRIVGTNLPFKTADIRFTLQPDHGATVVTVSPDYELRFGLLGVLLDHLYVRRTYLRGMEALLAGLKRHVESG